MFCPSLLHFAFTPTSGCIETHVSIAGTRRIMSEICRTCLREVDRGSVIFYLDAVESQTETITIRCKLTDCVPEMDLDVVPNAFICNSCFESLTVAHEFKNKCLETEGRIQSYIEQMGYILTSVDLREIVQQQKTDGKSKAVGGFQESKPVTLYDANKNTIESKQEQSLDLRNLQCDTRAFFAVPKIAQLLAEGSSCSCKQCGYRAVNEVDLKVHEETHRDSDRTCSKCSYTASSELDLKSHEEAHFREIHKCSECEYTASKRQALIVHMRKHSEKPYRCDCGYTTLFRASFLQHSRTHGEGSSHKCGFCDFTSECSAVYSKHLRSHDKLQCDLCGYKTRLKLDLKTHMRVHEKPYKCLLCNYSSSHKSNLVHHMRVHGGERRYKCKLCDYKAKQKVNLQHHMKVHSAEKYFKCFHCTYATSHYKSLTNHMRTHAEKPYSCTFCEYSSSEKINIIKHIMTHTEKPLECLDLNIDTEKFLCSTCQKSFKSEENMKRHAKQHAKESEPVTTCTDLLNESIIDATAHISAETTDRGGVPSEYQISQDNNCESAVKKMII